jgi:transcriptional regulator with XRE-family HTH domain
MKKAIFDKKMENPRFKAMYDQVSTQMNIGEQIAQLRHEAKMSQLELAKKVSTSRTAIVRYESGDYNRYNVGTLMRIARALHKKLKISFSA